MLKFYKCAECGNVVELLSELYGELSCCGEPMSELVPNTVEASKEKHVPFAQSADGKIIVSVGSVLHPMEEKHYIEWILFDDGVNQKRVTLKPGDKPEAVAEQTEKCVIYAYCNIHGLWKSNFS
jgi:superoxide reductase